MSEQKPKMSTGKKIVGTVLIFAITAIVIIAAISLLPNNPTSYNTNRNSIPTPTPKIQAIKIRVEYSGEWQGAYGDGSSIVSWDGNGDKTVKLYRDNDSYFWIVSANAQKQDDSSATLTIKIMLNDGTVLKQAATKSPYGIAQVTETID